MIFVEPFGELDAVGSYFGPSGNWGPMRGDQIEKNIVACRKGRDLVKKNCKKNHPPKLNKNSEKKTLTSALILRNSLRATLI